VLLAVESQRGRRLSVLAEPSVLNTLLTHRLHELQSTGVRLLGTHIHQSAVSRKHELQSGPSSVC
jgi:hypothetical protein